MKRLPTRVQRYIWLSLIPAATVIAIAGAVDHSPSVPWPWLVYPLLIGLTWLGEEYRGPTRQASYTLTAAIHLPLILLCTPLEALALATAGIVVAQVRRRRTLARISYNAVIRVVSIGVAGLLLALWYRHDPRFSGQRSFLTFALLHRTQQGWYLLFGAQIALGCVLTALLYFVLDSVLIAVIVALETESNVLTAWQTNLRSTILPELTKGVLGIVAACLVVVNPIFVLFMLLPVAVAHVTTQAILRLERETVEAITTLADTIDRRDPYTAQHSERVARLSQRLARRLGLAHEQVEEVTLAARVHDLGKMGTPSEILLKSAPLTPAEMVVMQQHSRIGAEVLHKYRNFRKAVPIVLHHHERYDGRGYPDGLAGDTIPLGAQIVAHADAYDAMISDRPYRPGMRPDMAVQRISEGSGTQFDPAVTGAFVAMMYEEFAATGQTMPVTGGSLAERPPGQHTVADREKVRYLYRQHKG